MKLGQSANEPVRGSFGIPPEMKEAMNKAQEKKEAAEQPKEKPAPTPVVENQITDEIASQADPYSILKTLGIEFNDEMFNQLLFKGFIEADVQIFDGKFVAKMKTLTTEEFDYVDQLLAEDVKTIPMTSDGFETRRSVWTMAFGITHLAGKPVSPLVLNKDKKTVDKIETARKRRQVIINLAPYVMNSLIQKHGAMTASINMIIASPGEHVKNS